MANSLIYKTDGKIYNANINRENCVTTRVKNRGLNHNLKDVRTGVVNTSTKYLLLYSGQRYMCKKVDYL